MKEKELVLFGNRSYADVLYEYFTHDSEYEVVAFTMERNYMDKAQHLGLPVVEFESLEKEYPSDRYFFHAAVVYNQLNRLRQRICTEASKKGYRFASYLSSRAFIWPSAKVGEHVVIMEDNTVQPFTEIGRNTILWSGNHIGHHSRIGDNVFISSHVVVSGHVKVGSNCFLGVNSSLSNGISIGEDSWISPSSTVLDNVPPHSHVSGPSAKYKELNEKALFKILGKKSN